MAIITYENVTPSLIENTTMRKLLRDGVHQAYVISPVDGYVLHDNARDWTDNDPVTGEEILYRGYTTGTASCGANYDFVTNPREFYAVPEADVPADQIFGVTGDHETM